MERGGQVSMEFLFIVGFAMLMTLPLIYVFFVQSQGLNSEISGVQADKVASEIRDAADEVYYLGEPSKKTILVDFPEGVNQVILNPQSIVFNVSSGMGNYEVVKWTVGNLTGNISNHDGLHKITLEARSLEVLITDN